MPVQQMRRRISATIVPWNSFVNRGSTYSSLLIEWERRRSSAGWCRRWGRVAAVQSPTRLPLRCYHRERISPEKFKWMYGFNSTQNFGRRSRILSSIHYTTTLMWNVCMWVILIFTPSHRRIGWTDSDKIWVMPKYKKIFMTKSAKLYWQLTFF